MSAVSRYWVNGNGYLFGCSPACEPKDDELVMWPDFKRVQAERDTLQLRLNATDQRIDELVSAVRSINRGRRHEVFVPGDDEPQYRQRKEWVDWVLSLCDEASASDRCHEIPGTSGMRQEQRQPKPVVNAHELINNKEAV